MKQTTFLFAFVLLLSLIACKPATTEEATVIPKTLFTSMVVKHHVKDYNVWKPLFIAHDSIRQANGLENIGVGRELGDSNMIIVINRVNDVAKAKEFAAMPGLKEIMDQSGVDGPPTFDWIHVVRNDSSDIAQNTRMMVKHHVKDFAAWLKVYDGEGKDTRAGFGLIDRALGRGVDDSNMVYIVFAVTDPVKAKARGESPELKKLMEDSGVEGAPEFVNYTFDMYQE